MSFGPDKTSPTNGQAERAIDPRPCTCLGCGADVWSLEKAVDRDGHPITFDREIQDGEELFRPHHCPAEPEPDDVDYDDPDY